MKLFFSCDWGTSTFRLRLVNTENATVISEIKTDHGIASTFESWKQTNQSETSRIVFYQNYLLEQLKKITNTFNGFVDHVPIILSGMASSSIGMIELPYKKLPFHCDGSDLMIHTIPAAENCPYRMIIISGARSEVDVMRGEETILAGCDIANDNREQLLIFPGTHSKHVRVINGLVQNITTYMTGELFDLLSNKSILSASVKKNRFEQTGDNSFFADGVMKGLSSNLLSGIFHIRTNQLLGKATAEENYHWLSGLLIGHELKEVAEDKPTAITLVCSDELKRSYVDALSILGLNDHLQCKDADKALVAGQCRIMQRGGY